MTLRKTITKRGLELVLREVVQKTEKGLGISGTEIKIQKMELPNFDGMVGNKYSYSYYVNGTLIARWSSGRNWEILV